MLKRTAGSVYETSYHLIFHVKYERKILVGEIAAKLGKLFCKISQNKGYQILEMEIMPEHIHLLVSVPPNTKIAEVVKNLKGVSSKVLFTEFPELRKILAKGHLWAPSYFVRTTGNVTMGTIKKYIKEQKEKHLIKEWLRTKN